jgi:TonB family protein
MKQSIFLVLFFIYLSGASQTYNQDSLFEYGKYFNIGTFSHELAINNDESLLAVGGNGGGEEGIVNLFEISSGKQVTSFVVGGYIRSMAFSPDGKLLLCGSEDFIKIYNLNTTELIKTIKLESTITVISFSNNGQLLGIITSNDINIYDANSFQLRFSKNNISERGDANVCMGFSPDGKFFAVGTMYRLLIFESSAGSIVASYNESNSLKGTFYTSISYSPKGNYLAASTYTGGVIIYDLNSRISTPILKDYANSLSYNNDGNLLAIAADQKGAFVYNVKQGKMIKSFSYIASDMADIKFSPQSNYLVMSKGGFAAKSLDGGAFLVTVSTKSNYKNIIDFNFQKIRYESLNEPPPPPPPPDTDTPIPGVENILVESNVEVKHLPDEIFTVVEEQPSFPGGKDLLKKFIQTNLIFPENAKQNGIEGKVYVTFVVEKDGTITNVSVIRSLCSECDQEAINVVKKFPKWIPGKQGGINVRVQFNLPIPFAKV